MPQPRILVTRSPHQASELADALRARNFEPILIPTIDLTEPTTFAPLDHALANLRAYHWLLFTSANAVHAFADRLKHLGLTGPLSLDPGPRVAAIGPSTARALATIGLNSTLVPPQAVAESLAAVLLPHARQADGSPTRFLLLRAETARDVLPETLLAAGAHIDIAPVYRTITPESSVNSIRDLFSSTSSPPDAITFTSSSTATNLFSLLKTANITLPPHVLRASIGPITSATLIALGYPPQLESDEATIHSLVEVIARYFDLK